MNKAELIEALAEDFDGNKAQAGRALNAVLDKIMHTAAKGEKVSITGFGVFESVHRTARMVRNPRTGERKRAKATDVPRFRAGTELKAYIAGTKKVPRAAKKAAAKSTTAKAAATKAAPAKKTAVKATKAAATRATASKAAATAKAPARSAAKATKAAPAKRAAATKSAATKTVAKKATATKTVAKAPAKTAAKKTATRRSAKKA